MIYLFDRLYDKKQKVRLAGVRFSDLVPMTVQINLFDDALSKLQLFKTVDKIKNRYGSDMITKAITLKKDQ